MAAHVAKEHLRVHRALELRPATALNVLETVDAFRKPERFVQLLLACEADIRGRTGLDTLPYPAADYLREIHSVTAAISANDVEAEYQGKAIGERIRSLRTLAIKEFKEARQA